MKRILSLTLLAVMLTTFAACSRERVTTEITELPQAAQTLIAKYYPGVGVSRIVIDTEWLDTSYDVVLLNGVDMDFNKAGELKDIETRGLGVPDGLLPAGIKSYVATNLPGRKVVKLDIERRGYKIELADGLEAHFDKSGRFLRYDD